MLFTDTTLLTAFPHRRASTAVYSFNLICPSDRVAGGVGVVVVPRDRPGNLRPPARGER